MLVIKNLVTLAVSVAVTILLLMLNMPWGWLFAVIGLIFAAFGVQLVFVVGKEIRRPFLMALLWNPLLFLSSIIFLSLLLESYPLRFLLAVLGGLANAVYFTYLFFFLYVPSRYEPHALERMSRYLVLFTIFGWSSGLFSLRIFLSLPVWLLALIFLVIIWLLLTQVFWISKLTTRKILTLSTLSAIILTELFIALIYLPASFYVNGAILTVVAYWLLDLLTLPASATPKTKQARQAGFVAALLVLIVILSAPWR
ncbi:MAG: hypothetical protein V1821_00820 [bacterium]